jgi:hypothetical protein
LEGLVCIGGGRKPSIVHNAEIGLRDWLILPRGTLEEIECMAPIARHPPPVEIKFANLHLAAGVTLIGRLQITI